MAKKKRPLASPFVPVEEQPYKIPENWCWVRLGNLCTNIQYGYTAKAVFDDNYPKMLRITDIQESGVDWDSVPNCNITENDFNKYELISNDIVFARTGATTGKSYFVLDPPKAVYASYLIRIRLNSPLNKKYVYSMLQSDVYWKQITELSSGIAQPGVNAAKLQSLVFPLAPIVEQQRIVNCIESLFAKLDEAKEKAQAVVDGFELRKSAILHKAFTGDLTEQWRKEHSIDEWFTSTFGQYTNSQYGYTESATQEPIGPKFLRITDIQDGTVDWDKVPYCNISKDDFEKYLIKSGDIMIARTGATTGKSYLIVDNVKAVFASYLIRLTIKQTGLMATYLYYFMQSPSYWQQITEFSAGTAQPGVNAKKLQKIELPIPSVEEQREIVFILDKFLKKEQQAKESAEAVLAQIDTMKKSILARAFRGGLGTNDPAEESAAVLVREALQDDK